MHTRGCSVLGGGGTPTPPPCSQVAVACQQLGARRCRSVEFGLVCATSPASPPARASALPAGQEPAPASPSTLPPPAWTLTAVTGPRWEPRPAPALRLAHPQAFRPALPVVLPLLALLLRLLLSVALRPKCTCAPAAAGLRPCLNTTPPPLPPLPGVVDSGSQGLISLRTDCSRLQKLYAAVHAAI